MVDESNEAIVSKQLCEMGLCGTPLIKPGGAAKGKLLGGRGTDQPVGDPDLLPPAGCFLGDPRP